jgi:hypothetical protein
MCSCYDRSVEFGSVLHRVDGVCLSVLNPCNISNIELYIAVYMCSVLFTDFVYVAFF